LTAQLQAFEGAFEDFLIEIRTFYRGDPLLSSMVQKAVGC
jgi:hypothetical protein